MPRPRHARRLVRRLLNFIIFQSSTAARGVLDGQGNFPCHRRLVAADGLHGHPQRRRQWHADKVRVGIVGVGNCACSFVQGLELLRRGDRQRAAAGADACRARRLPRRATSRWSRPSTSTPARSAAPLGEAILVGAEQHLPLRRARPPGVPVRARADARRHRPLHGRRDRGGGRAAGRRRRRAARDRHRDPRLLPAGRLAARDRVLRRAGAGGRLRLRQLHPGVHRLGPDLGAALRGARAADRRRRHQEPGRRDDPAPHARQPLPRARRAARPHLPAELRRQHRLQEHARARAADLEEDLEDPGGDEPARRAARRARRPRRPERLRAVARRTASGRTSASRAPPSAACR